MGGWCARVGAGWGLGNEIWRRVLGVRAVLGAGEGRVLEGEAFVCL